MIYQYIFINNLDEKISLRTRDENFNIKMNTHLRYIPQNVHQTDYSQGQHLLDCSSEYLRLGLFRFSYINDGQHLTSNICHKTTKLYLTMPIILMQISKSHLQCQNINGQSNINTCTILFYCRGRKLSNVFYELNATQASIRPTAGETYNEIENEPVSIEQYNL